ncbi:TPA: aconitase family protein [Escherichia coli]
MIKLSEKGVFLASNNEIIAEEHFTGEIKKEEAKKGTIAWSILSSHNTSGNMDKLKIKFDSLASHDITFVGIVQTAKASGMERFPLPYVLTNCHNSLCAVGGTINGDDHVFGLSAAQLYGGIFVPPHIAVIHQYMREMMAGGGKMILGSDSHTRYGALGTMAVGEGGGELVKQLLNDTWDIDYPGVVAVHLTGKPAPYVGPQDVALAIIGAVFKNGYVKNKVMEFVGPGVSALSTDFRNSVDVMTTETTCLSSVWQTDEEVHNWLALHGRGQDYCQLNPQPMAYYDGCISVDLSAIKPGDGSAREQAASCQRVIGGLANIAEEYATKRYRSNVINWGMLPLQMAEVPTFEVGDYIYIPGIKAALDNPGTTFKGYVIHEDAPVTEITLYMESLTAEEREIIKAGSLINFNKNRQM